MHRAGQRGSVLVLVIAILALLFIIGMTVLVMVHFDRESAALDAKSQQMRAAHNSAVNGAVQQLREDVVGRDGIPYNGS